MKPDVCEEAWVFYVYEKSLAFQMDPDILACSAETWHVCERGYTLKGTQARAQAKNLCDGVATPTVSRHRRDDFGICPKDPSICTYGSESSGGC